MVLDWHITGHYEEPKMPPPPPKQPGPSESTDGISPGEDGATPEPPMVKRRRGS